MHLHSNDKLEYMQLFILMPAAQFRATLHFTRLSLQCVSMLMITAFFTISMAVLVPVIPLHSIFNSKVLIGSDSIHGLQVEDSGH